MADEPAQPAEAAPEASAAPVEAAPAAVVETAAAEPAPSLVEGAAEAVAPVEAPAEAAPVEGEAKPAEPVVDAKPVEAKTEASAEPVVETPKPVYEAFTMPEGISAAPEQMGVFTDVLGKHGLSQEAGQELMDLHATALKQASDAMAQRQMDVFAETQRQWVADFDKHAGNRRDTILNDAKRFIADTVKDAGERKELWSVLAYTGAGNHPAVINLLAKAAKRVGERAAPPNPLPNNGARAVSAADRRYGPKT